MVLNRKHISLVGAALIAVGLLTLPVHAQMRHHGRGGGLALLIRAAQLRPDQKTAVHGIMQASRSSNTGIFSQLRELRQKVNSSLFSTGTADPNDLSTISSLQGQLAQARVKVFQQVWQLLDSTQQSQVASVYAQLQAVNAQRQSMWQSLHQTQPPTP